MANCVEELNESIQALKEGHEEEGDVFDTNKISDGYHTFGELYEHRFRLFIALIQYASDYVYTWKSKSHSDGTMYEGWFIAGIGVEKGEQITYHLPISMWNDNQLMYTEILSNAPEFDGHTSADVLERIKNL